MFVKKNILLNFFWLFLGYAGSAICFFVAMAYLGRVLGPSLFGVINFAEVVFMLFLTLTNMGLAFIGTRDVARSSDKVVFYSERILSLRMILSFLSLIALLIFLILLKRPFITKYTIFIYGVALIPASVFLDWLFQGLEQMVAVALSVFLRALVFLCGVLLLVKDSQHVFSVSLVFLISWFFCSALLFFIYKRKFGPIKVVWDKVFFKKALRSASPVGVSLLVGWIIHYFDSMLIFFTKGEAAAGQYNAAYRPIILIVTALTVYFNAIFPSLSKAACQSTASVKKIIDWTTHVGFSLFLPVAVLGGYLAGPLMLLVYGPAFGESGRIFSILIWWPLLVLLVLSYSRVILCYDKQDAIGKISLITAAANIGFNLILVPLWSGIGAAIAKAGADIITCFIYYRYTQRIFSVSVWNPLKAALGASVVLIIFLLFAASRLHLWPIIVGGLFVYFVSLFAFQKSIGLKGVF